MDQGGGGPVSNYLFYIGCGMILCAIGGAILLRWYLVTYTNRLMLCLNEMLAGKDRLEIQDEKELLMGKIEARLLQVYEILREQKVQSQKDKTIIETMISDISHQVKTPITNIRIYQGLLQNGDLAKEQRTCFVQQMEKQVDRLDALMDSLIQMSRLEAGIIQVKPVQQSLLPLIEEAICQEALKAEEKQIQIQVDCSSRLAGIFDKKWTVEALGNILNNAIKYTRPGGKVSVIADTTDFFVRIRIADTGKGIPEEHYTSIFKRFYREEDVQQEEGAGIGLFLAQEIIRKQSGYIDVKSQPGRGSVFSIYLPAEACA